MSFPTLARRVRLTIVAVIAGIAAAIVALGSVASGAATAFDRGEEPVLMADSEYLSSPELVEIVRENPELAVRLVKPTAAPLPVIRV